MSAYGGSFAASRDGFSSKSIKNANLPPLIKCSACKRNREHIHFSKRQISNLKFKATKGGPRNKYDYGPKPKKTDDSDISGIRCRDCVCEPTSELLCIGCGAIKDLSQFAKVQRKRPDDAKCLECMEEVARVGEDDDDRAVGVDYEAISDDDYDDYVNDDDRSVATGITNPWATYDDGDYVTASDVTSGRWPSEQGSDTRSVRGAAPASISHGGRSAYENARLAQYGGQRPGANSAQAQSIVRDTSQASRATESVVTTTRRMAVSTNNAEPTSVPGPDEWQTVGSRKSRGHTANTMGNSDQRPNAWGQNGQAAAHLRAVSSQSGHSNGREADATGQFSSPHTLRKIDDSRDRKFAKVRPENNVQQNPRKFAKIRPDNKFKSEDDNEDEDDDGEYYDLSKASGPAPSGSKYADNNLLW